MRNKRTFERTSDAALSNKNRLRIHASLVIQDWARRFPFRAVCGDIGDIKHFILLCPQFDRERKEMVRSLQKGCRKHGALEDVIFPEGPTVTKKSVQRILMTSLRDTGLSDIW